MMVLQTKTEKELIDEMESLRAEVLALRMQVSKLAGPALEPKSPVDILEQIQKHVTIGYVNKLYKKRQ
tara:strand:- start:207 stop:410 length:204 start_codon:yes stop_codon:yes gene_type:complete